MVGAVQVVVQVVQTLTQVAVRQVTGLITTGTTDTTGIGTDPQIKIKVK